ncbi:MAG TPA: ABC transporter substrate-binding protein [Nocardioidaceae bacterium]|jgi:osmoprotectant transport system substrate-binding protein
MRIKRILACLFAAATLFAVAGCGGDDNSLEDQGGSSDGGAGDKGSVTVGGQDFTESQVMAAIYQALLENEGFDVTTKLVQTRDIYLPELSKGNVDIVPDYLSGITDFLNTEKNGPDAPLVSSHSPEKTLAALKPLAEAKGISVLAPSDATDQNAFFVTTDFADENNLRTLSDLAALGQPIKLAANSDCPGRADCLDGLKNVYGLDISKFEPLEFGSAQMKDAVKSGEVDLGQTGTTDGTLTDAGFTLLQDDKGIQPAQNLTPVVNSDFLDANPDLEALFDKLSQTLSTQDLAEMNAKVDVERQKPEDVANEFLTENGLI